MPNLITGGQIITVYYTPYFFVGNGYLAGVPFTLFIVAAVGLFAWLMTRKTAVGMFVESIGINVKSSFYSGIDEKNIKLLVYTFSGICAGIAGLIVSSNIKSADANNAGLGFELDAILAVVIGGTLMTGGRFSLMASVIGALVIQSMTTTMYAIGVPAMAAQAVKAVVVMVVILLYSEQFRTVLNRLFSTKRGAIMNRSFKIDRKFVPLLADYWPVYRRLHPVARSSIPAWRDRRRSSTCSSTTPSC